MAMVAPQVGSDAQPAMNMSGGAGSGQVHESSEDQLGRGGVERQEDLISVRYNQDATCFACGTTSGFRLYSSDPLRETIRRDADGGGIGIAEMLFRCNLLALVGGGKNPRWPPNKVMIWDDNQNRCIGELTFRSEVRAVRLRRDRIVVVLDSRIYVYNFADLKVLNQIDTLPNPKGLCCLSQATNHIVLACPGLHKKQVRIDLFDMRRTQFITAHDSALACLALTLDGTKLATASEKGTLVRIWNTADGTQLQEVRRGTDRAEVYSIAFSVRTPHFALSSDKGTVHVFALNDSAAASKEEALAPTHSSPGLTGSGAPAAGANAPSSLSFMKGMLPKYFSSEWSLAQFRLPEDVRSLVAFGEEIHVVTVVCNNGRFYKLKFDPKMGGDMLLLESADFLQGQH